MRWKDCFSYTALGAELWTQNAKPLQRLTNNSYNPAGLHSDFRVNVYEVLIMIVA